jgi:hypothetical protein
MLWILARDDATPFSKSTGCISLTHKNPFNATLACGVVCTVLGCIYVGSFVVLSALSYLAAALPHMLSRRALRHTRTFLDAYSCCLHNPGYQLRVYRGICGYLLLSV